MSSSDVTDPVLDGFDRGLPPEAVGLRASALGAQQWHLHRDLTTPIAALRDDHLAHNAEVMRAWCAAHDVELWPHAKTTMSPQLIARQAGAAAHGFTAATFTQARLLIEWGVTAVLIANQVVDPRAAAWLAVRLDDGNRTGSGNDDGDDGLTLLQYVDSSTGIDVLQAAARDAGAMFDVLIELGAEHVRTGARTVDEALRLADELADTPNLRLVGVAGYEGSFGADRSDAALARVDGYLAELAGLLDALAGHGGLGTERPVFSAGGSMYFDRVEQASRTLGMPHRVVVRSGCYLLHDTGMFEQATPLPDGPATPGLRPALSVWGTVHSRPEATRAYLDIGRRDAGFDQGLPRPQRRRARDGAAVEPFTDATVVQLNDQHLHLELPADSPVAVGDRIEFGISHPCTTMDKWRVIPVVDADGAVVDAVTTRF